MEYIKRIDPDLLGDEYEEAHTIRGGGGGGKPEVFGGRGRQQKKGAEARKGQAKNALNRHESDEKSPVDEIKDVLDYINRQDDGNFEMPTLYAYLAWLKKNIGDIEQLEVRKDEISKMEEMTATLGAGGGGKDTSRNARAATHLLTGIRAKSQISRKAGPNEEDVREKIKNSLKKHLKNWKTVMTSLQTDKERGDKKPIDLAMLEEEVLKRVAG